MNKIGRYIFDKQWIPIVIAAISFPLILLGEWLNIAWVVGLFLLVFSAGIVYLFYAAIIFLWKKKWLYGIVYGVSFLISCVAMAGLIFVFFLWNLISPDHWADNLTIPEGIEMYEPHDHYKVNVDSVKNALHPALDFELYTGGQPGMYTYDVWLDSIGKGKIFLKAFEITQEYELSGKSLKKSTAVQVENQLDTILRISPRHSFTIYEGDWGKPYAARFEVWFEPSNGASPRKIMEKIFKIEGWMH